MKASCLCGGVAYEITDLPQFRGIPLGVIDDDGVPEPQMHVWTQSRVDWESISDALPQFSRHP